MKTQEEIEQLAEKLYPVSPNPKQMIEGFERVAFKKGYTQCQEDVADMKYTEEDMRQAFIAGVDCESRNGKNFNQFIDSLNKQ